MEDCAEVRIESEPQGREGAGVIRLRGIVSLMVCAGEVRALRIGQGSRIGRRHTSGAAGARKVSVVVGWEWNLGT